MIKYREGEFLDLLPSYLKDNPDYAAISYAFKMAVGLMSHSQDLTWLYSSIDTMPEEILDLMALELKAPYYSERLDIETRRQLVKKAMLWRFKAGTKAAVEEMVQTVFGEGKVTEWFEYEPERTPGTFGIETDAVLTPDIFAELSKVIEYVKNETSHLDEISVKRKTELDLYAAAHPSAAYTHEVPIYNKVRRRYRSGQRIYAGSAGHQRYVEKIYETRERTVEAGGEELVHQASVYRGYQIIREGGI